MSKVVIDTNALISFVTDRNPAQQEKIAAVLEDASKLKATILCPQNVLTEFVYILEKVYNQPKSLIHSMIADFLALPGVRVIQTVDFEALLQLWPADIADFGDAIVAVVSKAEKGSRIATFDERFVRALQSIGLSTVRF